MEKKEYENMYLLEKRHWWFAGKRKIIYSMISKMSFPQGLILDFGCGTGGLLEELSSKYQAVGMDISPEAIGFARKRGLKNVEIIEKNWQLERKYSLIVASDVMEHIEDDVFAFNKLWDALLPGGKLLITVPAFQFLWSKHDVVLHHYRRYDRDLLEEHSRLAGFCWSYISYYNFFLFPPAFIVRLLQKLFSLSKIESNTVSLPPTFFNKIFYLIFQSEKYFLGKLCFPFGLSLFAIATKHE